MSAPKHTPGPWIVVDDHPERANLHVMVDTGHVRCGVAVLYGAPGDTNDADGAGVFRWDAERMANARLIAAAPTMHALLAEIVDACDADDQPAFNAAVARAHQLLGELA